MLMAHKQSYVAVMLNKRRYSYEIAVFNMSTVILHDTLKLLSMKRDSLCHSVIIALLSNCAVLNFRQ